MTNWKLSIKDIGGFKDSNEFILKDGINLIVGDNATGKTSIVNAIKLLNNLSLKEESKESKNGNFTYQDFLNDKTKNGIIELSNEHVNHHLFLTSPVGKITSYLDGNTPLKRSDKSFITNDPNVVKFTFLDKNNNLMESIEYSGTIELIKDEIIKLSNIDNYELIQNHVKQLNLEYLERKEKEVKVLNDNRKEIELKIQENLNKSEELQNDLKNVQFDKDTSDELNQLKIQLQNLNNNYNKIRLKELDELIQEKNKTIAKIDKNKKKLKSLKNKKIELEKFNNIENSININQRKVQDYDNEIKELNEQKKVLNLNRHNLLQQIQLLKETLENSEEDIICHHCLSPINVRKVNQKIEELTLNKEKVLEKIRNFESEAQTLEKKRNKLNYILLDQKNLPIKLKNINSEINDLEKRISVNETKKQKLENEIKVKNQQLKAIQEKIDKMQKTLLDKSTLDDELKEKYTELITKTNLIKQENDKLNSKKNLLIQKILILPENYDLLIKRTEILIEKLNEYIENFYLEFIDTINSELAILLEKLEWKFQEVFIDDDLNLIIKNSEGKPQKFHSLSNFEKKSISIVILLIIKMKYFPNYPIFVIDEHLNSADSARFIKFIPHLYEKILKSNIKLFIATSLPNDSEIEVINNWDKNQYGQLTIYYKQ